MKHDFNIIIKIFNYRLRKKAINCFLNRFAIKPRYSVTMFSSLTNKHISISCKMQCDMLNAPAQMIQRAS